MNAAMNNAFIEKLIKLEVYLAELIDLVYDSITKTAQYYRQYIKLIKKYIG